MLVENNNSEHRNVIGKTMQNLPVALEAEDTIETGSIIEVKVNQIKTHTLIGNIIKED